MRFVEEIQHFLSTKRRHSFALMDKVGFKEHVKKRPKCTSSDASEEWEAAISDPAIHQEVEDGEVVIAVKEWTRLIGDSGTARNRSLVLDEDLPDAAAGGAALQKLRQLGSFGDHHFAESGGGVVAQSRGLVARGATSASKRVLEVASLTRRAFEQLVSGFGSKPAAVVPAVVAGQLCGEGASTVMSPSTPATSAFGGTPKLPEEQELPFGHRVMQPQPHHQHQPWKQQQCSAHGSCPPTPELQLASRLSLQQLKTVKKESQASLKKAMSDMEDKAKALQSVLDKNAKLPESLAVGEHAGLLSLISSLREACNTAIAGVHSWTLTSMSEQENAAAELLAQMEGAADKAGTLRACILEAVNAERVESRKVATRLRYRNDKWTKIFKQGGFGDEATKQIITLMDMPRDDPIYSLVGGFDHNPEELNPKKVCVLDTQTSPLAKSLMAYCALMTDRIAEKKAVLVDLLKDRRSGAQGGLAQADASVTTAATHGCGHGGRRP
jgi:hypothetical protein